MARKNSKWIQKAIKKPGSFKAYCKRLGYSGVTQECIERGMRSKNPKTRRRANLARTLKKLPKSKKKRR